MRKNRNPKAFRWIALLLALVQLFTMAGCVRKDVPDATDPSTDPTVPTDPQPHEHLFANGVCECGETNGLEGFTVEVAEGLNAVQRGDTEAGMVLTSDNAAGETQNIRLNKAFDAAYSHYYEIVYRFTSTAAGTVRFAADGVCYESGEYEVVAGENEIAVRFAAGEGSDGKVNTSLELGGLGAFELMFSGITLTEMYAPHTHSFVNGRCGCGADNGFSGVQTWTEGSLIPVVQEDTERTMILRSENTAGDWWKVKLEWPLNVTEGKTYEATFAFTSNVAGTIKYCVNDAAFLDSQDYNVVVGANTFTVQFTAGAENYSCLELGGLGSFELTFTGISLREL